MFIPPTPVIHAARRQSQSALPDAPVVNDACVQPRGRCRFARRTAARLLSATAMRLAPCTKVVTACPEK